MLIGTFFNSTRFWSEEFWLPPKESWGNINAPQTRDFIYGIFSAIVLCVLRVILHNCVFTPIGLHNGLRLTKSQEVPNIPLLEEYYQFNKRPPFNDIRALSKKLDVSDAKVSYWFRAKRNSVKFPIIVKFAESGWRFSFYFCLFSYGICCLYQEPFLYDTSEFFRAYPHHEMSRCIFWYYMIELAYYVSGLIWAFVEVKRKAAKMFKYLEKFWPCMACFTTFICVWIATRLYYYPFRIIASLFYDAPVLIGFYPALSAFAVFLITLQLLHIFWTVQIIRTAVKPFTTGQLTSDARSDSEMSDTDNDCTTGIHANGVAKAK